MSQPFSLRKKKAKIVACSIHAAKESHQREQSGIPEDAGADEKNDTAMP
jgi:hypothetical protein